MCPMITLRAGSVVALGPGCLLTLAASLSQPWLPAHLPQKEARRRQRQVVWRRSSRRSDPGSDLFLALPGYGHVVLCYSPGTPRFSLQALRAHTGICQTVASPRCPAESGGRAAAPGCRRVAPVSAAPGLLPRAVAPLPLPGGCPG